MPSALILWRRNGRRMEIKIKLPIANENMAVLLSERLINQIAIIPTASDAYRSIVFRGGSPGRDRSSQSHKNTNPHASTRVPKEFFWNVTPVASIPPEWRL